MDTFLEILRLNKESQPPSPVGLIDFYVEGVDLRTSSLPEMESSKKTNEKKPEPATDLEWYKRKSHKAKPLAPPGLPIVRGLASKIRQTVPLCVGQTKRVEPKIVRKGEKPRSIKLLAAPCLSRTREKKRREGPPSEREKTQPENEGIYIERIGHPGMIKPSMLAEMPITRPESTFITQEPLRLPEPDRLTWKTVEGFHKPIPVITERTPERVLQTLIPKTIARQTYKCIVIKGERIQFVRIKKKEG